jgi:putative Ca2+/H+ antiporter (TMEM165/GDT1 family)
MLGMVISDGLAIGLGRILGRGLPERAIKIGAAIIFVIFGLIYVAQGFVELW